MTTQEEAAHQAARLVGFADRYTRVAKADAPVNMLTVSAQCLLDATTDLLSTLSDLPATMTIPTDSAQVGSRLAMNDTFLGMSTDVDVDAIVIPDDLSSLKRETTDEEMRRWDLELVATLADQYGLGIQTLEREDLEQVSRSPITDDEWQYVRDWLRKNPMLLAAICAHHLNEGV